MVSRRRALRAGSAALAAVLAGCADGDDQPTAPDDPQTTDDTEASAGASSATQSEPTLNAESVAPSDVSTGATVAVATPALHDLVETAANAEERVDLVGSEDASGDEPLALGQFDYLRFRDETYDAASSFARFAGEASYQYSVEEVDESQVWDADGNENQAESTDANESEVESADENGSQAESADVLRYADLNESERSVAKEVLTSGSYSVGHHEEKPDAVARFEQHQYLRTGNATYRVRVTVGDHAAHYMLRLDAANPGEDAQVVTVADDRVPEELRDTVTAAVSDGSAPVSNPEELASFLDGVDYVVTTTAAARLELTGTGSA